MRADEAFVTASVQNPFGLRDWVARTIGLKAEKVHVTTSAVGGAYGRKNACVE